MKTCRVCRQTKPTEDFHKDRRRGWQSACKPCKAEYNQRYREIHGPKVRGYRLKQYNMDPSQYEQMFTAQGGVCAICKTNPNPDRVLCVDHNKRTGKVRQLLCIGCNTGIGSFQEDPERMLLAIDYLANHREV